MVEARRRIPTMGLVEAFIRWISEEDRSPPEPRKYGSERGLWLRFCDWFCERPDGYEKEDAKFYVSSLERGSETLERLVLMTVLMPPQVVLMSKKPSKEDLDKLKYALGIEKGSMQYKKRGDGVYLATYNSERKGYDWKRLGTWTELKSHIPLS
jgi:hypothetical protein